MVYLVSKDKVLFQTKSHTLINSLLESDSIKEEKSLERYKHIVTRSISGKPSESSIGYQSIRFSEDDIFIICSDGCIILFLSNRYLNILRKEMACKN
jgi:protein phosphatase